MPVEAPRFGRLATNPRNELNKIIDIGPLWSVALERVQVWIEELK